MEIGVHVVTAQRWERGTLGIGPSRRPALAAALGISARELNRILDEDSADAPAEGPGEREPAPGGPRAWTAEAPRMLTDWEQAAYGYACFLPMLPPEGIVDDLAADFAELRRALDEAGADQARAGLLKVGAQMAAVMAIALVEAGGPPAAARWWRTARSMAASSGDVLLDAQICGRHALTMHGIGLLTLANRLADETADLVGDLPCAGLAEATAARAQILAHDDPAAARAELAALEALAPALPAELREEHLATWGWPDRRFLAARTAVLAELGDAGVVDELGVELKALDPGLVRDRAQAGLKLAWALVRAGRAEEGLKRAAEVIAELPPGQRTAPVVRLATRVFDALPAPARDLPLTQDLRDLIVTASVPACECRTPGHHPRHIPARA